MVMGANREKIIPLEEQLRQALNNLESAIKETPRYTTRNFDYEEKRKAAKIYKNLEKLYELLANPNVIKKQYLPILKTGLKVVHLRAEYLSGQFNRLRECVHVF